MRAECGQVLCVRTILVAIPQQIAEASPSPNTIQHQAQALDHGKQLTQHEMCLEGSMGSRLAANSLQPDGKPPFLYHSRQEQNKRGIGQTRNGWVSILSSGTKTMMGRLDSQQFADQSEQQKLAQTMQLDNQWNYMATLPTRAITWM